MMKTFDDYLNDPRIKDEPMGLRITHAMRFKVQDETKDMTAAERTAYYNGKTKKADGIIYISDNGDSMTNGN